MEQKCINVDSIRSSLTQRLTGLREARDVLDGVDTGNVLAVIDAEIQCVQQRDQEIEQYGECLEQMRRWGKDLEMRIGLPDVVYEDKSGDAEDEVDNVKTETKISTKRGLIAGLSRGARIVLWLLRNTKEADPNTYMTYRDIVNKANSNGHVMAYSSLSSILADVRGMYYVGAVKAGIRYRYYITGKGSGALAKAQAVQPIQDTLPSPWSKQ